MTSPGRTEAGMSRGTGPHRVEAVVDEMLQVLAHANLPHQLVFVAIHASQLPHVCKYVLQSICQLQHNCPSDVEFQSA